MLCACEDFMTSRRTPMMNNVQRSMHLLRINRHYKQFLSTLSGKGPQCCKPQKLNVPTNRDIHANRCSSKSLSHLTSRAIVRLSGPDTLGFLQGLVTNDVYQLTKEGVYSQYTMMLNVQGRVLYDLFLYNISQDPALPVLLVEVDSSAKEELVTIFKRYKLRKKVDIADASDEFYVWSKFKISTTDTNISKVDQQAAEDVVIATLDPRVPSFGKRIIRKAHSESPSCDGIIELDGPESEWITNSVDESMYRQMRYQWGIPEGPADLPTGNCFPLESNLVFMNGVDFHKGCYIGQELTARTHHTGVTRKRLMPISLLSPPSKIEKDLTVVNEKGKNAGKFRTHVDGHGLAVIRLAYINDNLSITVGDSVIRVKTHAPAWWPPLDTLH